MCLPSKAERRERVRVRAERERVQAQPVRVQAEPVCVSAEQVCVSAERVRVRAGVASYARRIVQMLAILIISRPTDDLDGARSVLIEPLGLNTNNA